jgi:hypothetical protein
MDFLRYFLFISVNEARTFGEVIESATESATGDFNESGAAVTVVSLPNANVHTLVSNIEITERKRDTFISKPPAF